MTSIYSIEMVILFTLMVLVYHSLSANEEASSKEKASKEEFSSREPSTGQEKLVTDNGESSTKEESAENQSPHIIFILADDLGWNDVSFHGSPEIPTPNIDALAANSIILNNYYTESNCAPARASLMSGQYPIHLGLQHTTIRSGEPIGLPLDVTIMPEHFKSKGYATCIVGKWHLGYFKKDYTPTKRGFDAFFGFYNEKIDYYDYTNYQKFEDPNIKPFYGIDLQDGTTPLKDFRGTYATEVFTGKAVSFIEKHNESKPLFLYLAHLAAHTGNEYLPLQAPMNSLSKNAHIQNFKRRLYAGIVSALDDSVGKLVDALNKRGFLEHSIIVFTSDNGGGVGSSSNWPLRGQKKTSWEGGVKVPCFVWSPLLQLKEPRTSNQLMHVSDWLPTLYNAVGGDVTDLGKIDGYNLWNALIKDLPSPRIEVLHNIDPISGTAAVRRGDYKLISGVDSSEKDLQYGADMREIGELPASMDEWVFKNSSIVKNIFEDSNLWLVKYPDSWRNSTSLTCKQPTEKADCDPNQSPCLFNIAADPCEYNNLAARYPRIVRSMMRILSNYNSTAEEPLLNSTDLQGDPRCHSFTFIPWLDEENIVNCRFISD